MSASDRYQATADILDITEDDIDTSVRRSLLVESGITKDNTSLGGADFDGRSNVVETMWANGMRRRSLD